MSHPGGRPTVATPENVAKAQAYVDGEWQKRTFGPKAKGWKIIMPTVEDLALYLGIDHTTINARPEFSPVLQQLKGIQANTLVNGGVVGVLNPVMTKMVLASKHGYVEKTAQAVDNTSSDGSMSPKEPVDKSVVDSLIAGLKDQTKA